MRILHLLPFLIALTSRTASAQLLVQTTQPITYTPLPSPTILATSGDENNYAVTPPFPIMFYGTTFTTMTVSDNGVIAFPSGVSLNFINAVPGVPDPPNGFIAAFWDDLQLYAGTGNYLGHQTQGTAPNRTFTVEWRNTSRFLNSNVRFSIQIRFFEGQQRYEIDYGPMTGTESFTATMGMEDPSGGNPILFAPRACSSNCTQTDYNALANHRVIIARPVRPELTGSFGAWPRGAFPGSEATGMVTLTNLATNTATNVVTDLYLSTDDRLDPATDLFAGTIESTTLEPGDNTVPATITVPANAPVADYYLLARIDAPNDWSEINELDNDFEGPRFATAYELQPTGVSTMQPGIHPGDLATFTVQVTNNGVPRVGPLDIAIYISPDNIYDGGDQLAYTATANLIGQNVESPIVSGPLPTNLNPGNYFAIAVLDPANQISETNETNNVYVSAATFRVGPDFGVASVVAPASIEPGMTGDIVTTISSLAAPYSGTVGYRLWASTDQMLGNDTQLGTYSVTFAGEASLADTQTVTFPAQLPAGAYYVIAEVDPTGAIAEISENNNSAVSNTAISNAPDFRISGVTVSPSTVQVGTQITVEGTLENAGVPFSGTVPYGIFISPNNVFDPGDTLIQSDSVTINGGTTQALSASFNVPSVPPGTYTLFVVADPMNTVPEAIESNNTGAATGNFVVQGADLRVISITGSPVAFIGRTYQVTLTLANTGIAEARDFQYAYYLSEDQSIRVFDTQVFVSQPTVIASGEERTFVDTITIPTMSSTTSLYLGVLVDIYTRVAETNVNNNIGRIDPALSIVFPIPDLIAQIVETATVGAAGEQFAITRQILNVGVAEATAFDYAYYLSSNPVISTDDIEIGRFNLTLGEGEDDYGVDLMTIPSNVPAGTYFLGLITDPDGRITEVSDDNNAALGPSIPIFAAAIQFVTDRLPNATTGVAYEAAVYARGGPLPITWSVESGALPSGFAIDPSSGIISGTTNEEGVFNFVLRASSGTAYATRPYSIRVTAPTVELEIASPSLPSGIVGRPYEANLIAVGGAPPYTWEAISPLEQTGLTLNAEGIITGVPTTPGTLSITVGVRDSLNNSDSRALLLAVLEADKSVQIAQIPLPKALIGVPYCEPETVRLEASEGVPPYSWSLIGSGAPGMSLSPSGELCGTPEQAGIFALTVRAQDATGLFDTALFAFQVSGGNDLTISTFTLPNAEVGVEYAERVTVSRGVEPYRFELVPGAGELPPGLALTEDGNIVGNPIMDGVFAFVVKVEDSQLRLDTQPLSIRVLPSSKMLDEEGGCGCTASHQRSSTGSLLLLGLLFVSNFVFRARKRCS